MVSVRSVVLAGVILLAVAGCGSVQDGSESGRRITSTHVPAFTAPMTTPPPSTSSPVRTTAIAASCAREPWAFGFSPVEAASGNRYLSIQVRNCGTQSATVPQQPAITVRAADGDRVAVQWDWRAPESSRVVAAGHFVSLQLHWLSNGRCERGASALDMVVGGQTAHVDDCLQLGGLDDVTGQPTVADAMWAPAP